MTNSKFLLSLTLLCGVSLSACSSSGTLSTGSEHADVAIGGGAVGALAGTATGAAIGAAISNGDVAASALAGGGVGLAVGVVGGLIYHAYTVDSVVLKNDSRIRDNQEAIASTQDEIDRYRNQVDQETSAIHPDESLAEYKYVGPSLGNPYR